MLIARATERVRLGPAALNPYTLHPVEIAGQIAALDLASDGRAFLGLAHGSWLDRLALDQPRPVQTMRETVEIVSRLLAGDRSGFAGERFSLRPGAGLEFEPLRPRVPLMLGTWRPRLAALAAELADEVKIGGCANPAMVRLMREWIGREDVGVVVGAVTVVDRDGAAARALARRKAALYLPVIAALDRTLPLEPDLLARITAAAAAYDFERAARDISDELLGLLAFAGTPGEVAAQAEALFAAGAARIEFGTPHGLTEEVGLKLLGEEVLPALRSQ